ncbi:hypothetical protein VTK73DRAFT_846 [Phialemonium thermophilum]|uniref:Programmed cell death protein 2 C-terminal domain-containing protein n=1 Tax=Phialemonium thermophilum TaxID=223376 RepID=A0ABR3XDB0_9PEZI
MAPYDSDSSDGEEEEFTETDVLLGFASKDAKGETISRLGGRPDWFDASKPPSAALARCKVCKDLMVLLLQLNGELPDRFPGHERRLYVFSCRKKTCRRKEGSIRALRGVRVTGDVAGSKPEPADAPSKVEKLKGQGLPRAPAPTPGLGEALFGVTPTATRGSGPANPFSTGANPFSTGANPFQKSTPSPAAANPFAKTQSTSPEVTVAQQRVAPTSASTNAGSPHDAAATLPKTFAETLSLDNLQTKPYGPPPPPEPWPQESDQPAPYPVSWLSDAEYETLDPTPPPRVPPSAAAMDIDSSEGTGSGGGKEDKEVFESSMDATFQRFADRIGQNPEQCIRYEFCGQPLLYSKTDAVGKRLAGSGAGEKVADQARIGIPRCQNCGAGRVFEVQLMPKAIEELETEEDGLDGMDWGTIIVGVCEKDCLERGQRPGEGGYLEEWAGVQWEELTVKR